jgi:hypothetical protein
MEDVPATRQINKGLTRKAMFDGFTEHALQELFGELQLIS